MVVANTGGRESFGLSYTTAPFLKESKGMKDEQDNGNQTQSDMAGGKEEAEAASAVVTAATESSAATCDGGENQEAFLKAVKEEPEVEEVEEGEEMGVVDDMINGGDCNNNTSNNGSSSSTSSDVLAKPMEGLQESGPPPFLRKTFEMVEDPETDPIVSWSVSRNSFVVWDSHKFSENLLPGYFKHKNFSSFIRQLNTYGFRKIDSDRWEFANEGFQGGKKHLLKNIKRRSRYNKQQQGGIISNSSNSIGLEAELEILKKDKNALQLEVLKLKQQQEESNHQVSAVEERIRFAECKQQQMCNFFARIAKNPNFIQQLIQKRKQQKKELDEGVFSKKRKLLETQVTKSLPDQAMVTDQSVKRSNQVDQEGLESMQPAGEFPNFLPDGMENNPEIEEGFSVSIEDRLRSSLQDQKSSAAEMSSVYHVMSENLLWESSVVDNARNEDQLSVNDSKIYLELEDLINWKPCSWGGFTSELVEQTGCV